jgi:hypothetical protein
VTVREIAPTASVAGLTALMAGVGLTTVTLLIPTAFALAELTAVIVMVSGFGRPAGAV